MAFHLAELLKVHRIFFPTQLFIEIDNVQCMLASVRVYACPSRTRGVDGVGSVRIKLENFISMRPKLVGPIFGGAEPGFQSTHLSS